MRTLWLSHLVTCSICALCAVWAPQVVATDHVLIMTISQYPRNPLAGVKHDANNAIELAKQLGYDTRKATRLSDGQLTASGIRKALIDLSEQVNANDRVFFYYSGHGASYLNPVGQCQSALVSQDEKLVDMLELRQLFDRIKSKVKDAVAMFDACHSGGLKDLAVMSAGKTRSASDAPAHISGKVWTPKEGESCSQPVNFTKSWAPPALGTRGISNPDNNFTFIAAASEQQIALDDRDKGGLATLSLLQCLRQGVPAQGLATASSLVACAQEQVNAAVPEINRKYGTQWLAHTVELSGNTYRPLLDVKTRPLEPAIAAALANPDLGTSRAANSAQVLEQFKHLLAGANGNWSLSVKPSAQSVSLSQAADQRIVRFPYTSTQAGYGYILYVGTDGMDMQQLFPDPGENNAMSARGEFIATRIHPPKGKNTFLFILSDTPKDFSAVFKAQTTTLNTPNLTSLQCEVQDRPTVWINGHVQCGQKRPLPATVSSSTRGTATPRVQGYAAQLIDIDGLQ